MNDPTLIARAIQLYQRARTQWTAGEQKAALASFEASRRLLPDHLPLLAEYAQRAYESNQWEMAATLYRHIGKLKPTSNFEGPLGLALVQQHQFAEAIPFLRTQLARVPHELVAWQALAAALAKTYQWEESLACAKKISQLDPHHPALDIELSAHFYMGNAEALDAIAEPIIEKFRNNPAILAILGMHMLKRGDFVRGFSLQYECGWGKEHDRSSDADIADLPAWDGKPSNELLLITGEQGLGEEILAARFYRALLASGQPCVITCEPRLLPIFRRSFPTLEFIAHNSPERATLVSQRAPRYRLRALDLGHFFLTQTLADDRPWIQPDMARAESLRREYRERWPARRTVGVSWASRRRIHDLYGKSMPVTALAPLFARKDLIALNAQYGDIQADLDELAAHSLPAPWQDPSLDTTQDLDGLLAQLAALDGYIGVSNSNLHLAGAAGIPACQLLPERDPVFWYWGYAGERTPWYPSLRLFRNGPDQDWQATLQRALDTL